MSNTPVIPVTATYVAIKTGFPLEMAASIPVIALVALA